MQAGEVSASADAWSAIVDNPDRKAGALVRCAVAIPEASLAGRRDEEVEDGGRFRMRYSGDIVEVLALGTYGHADITQISYDELYDLVRQAELIAGASAEASRADLVQVIEHQTKHSLHPALGGEEPYELDPRMLWELPLQ